MIIHDWNNNIQPQLKGVFVAVKDDEQVRLPKLLQPRPSFIYYYYAVERQVLLITKKKRRKTSLEITD